MKLNELLLEQQVVVQFQFDEKLYGHYSDVLNLKNVIDQKSDIKKLIKI